MIATICLLALPVACVSWTIAEAEVSRSIRERIAKWANWHKDADGKYPPTHGWKQKLAYLPTCYYCTSHYVALAFLHLHPFHTLTEDFRGYIISWFSVVGMTAIYCTSYNLLRVLLRWGKAKADSAGAMTATTDKPQRKMTAI